MIFEQIECGGDRNYGYLTACEKTLEGIAVDPSPDPSPVIEAAKKYGISLKYVINTHSHSDHTGGNSAVIAKSGAKLVTFTGGGGDIEVGDGAVISAGNLSFEIFYTPGHTIDSICILVNAKLMTGDTLFVGKIGGTYGEEDSRLEFESLKRLMTLPENTGVYPGHNYGIKSSSTILYEKENNPFIARLNNFKDFLWLKQNWASYKQEHGIK